MASFWTFKVEDSCRRGGFARVRFTLESIRFGISNLHPAKASEAKELIVPSSTACLLDHCFCSFCTCLNDSIRPRRYQA